MKESDAEPWYLHSKGGELVWIFPARKGHGHEGVTSLVPPFSPTPGVVLPEWTLVWPQFREQYA